MSKLMKRALDILGDNVALRLRIYKPSSISPNNLFVYSYLDSVEGAVRRGELVFDSEKDRFVVKSESPQVT